MSESSSLPDLLRRWRAGDESAADELYRQFATRLCRLAARKLDPALGRRVDEDDVMQSVMRTYLRRSKKGEYSIDDYGSLWSLLAQITINKVCKYGAHHRAIKRDIGAEAYPDAEAQSPEHLAREPLPEEVAITTDEINACLESLPDTHAQIVRFKLQGHSTAEIAQLLNMSRWTVNRVLSRLMTQLSERAAEESDR